LARLIVVWMNLSIVLHLADIVLKLYFCLSTNVHVWFYEICGGQVALGQIFLRVRLFFLVMQKCFLLIRHSSQAITIGHVWLDCQKQKKFRNTLWPVCRSVEVLRWQAIEVTGLVTEVEETGIGVTGILMFVQLFLLQVNYTFDHLSSCLLNYWTLKIWSPSSNTKCSCTEYIDLQIIRESTLLLFRWTIPVLLHVH